MILGILSYLYLDALHTQFIHERNVRTFCGLSHIFYTNTNIHVRKSDLSIYKVKSDSTENLQTENAEFTYM